MGDSKRNSFFDSINPSDERLQALKQLYPELFSDGKINTDILREIAGEENPQEERTPGYYGLYWPGKRKAKIEAKALPKGILVPVPGDGVNEENTHNIYIEGDNLEVLRILKQSYKGRVKMIYIDPPYNTGSDFIYPDNYKMPVDEYLKITGQTDDKGKPLTTNQKSNGAFHTNWLNMMLPRLMLARELLTEDGVIFISIDDNEQANLKLLCDEVFGEENFVSQISVKMSEPTGVKMSHATTRLPKLKEYLLMYSRNECISLNSVRIPKEKWDPEYKTFLHGITEQEALFIKSIRDSEEHSKEDLDKVDDILKKVTYTSLSEIYKQNGLSTDEERSDFNYENAWRIIQTVSTTGGAKDIADQKKKDLNQVFYGIITPEDKMYFIKSDYDDSIGKPRIKVLFADDYLTYNPCDFWQDIKTTGLDNEGNVPFKNGKKPLKLIERILHLCTKNGDTVLDFFSGSGTLGEAVLNHSREEIKNLRYILVQFPENIDEQYVKASKDEKKTLQKAIKILDSTNSPHNICELGKYRIRSTGKKILEEFKEKNGSVAVKNQLDIGFKVYRLDKSNFITYTPTTGKDDSAVSALFAELEKNTTPLVDGWKAENVLTEIILKQGFALDCECKKEESFSQNTVYRIKDSDGPAKRSTTLYVCFDNIINPETIESLKLGEKEKFICLDSAIDDTNYARLCDKGRIETI